MASVDGWDGTEWVSREGGERRYVRVPVASENKIQLEDLNLQRTSIRNGTMVMNNGEGEEALHYNLLVLIYNSNHDPYARTLMDCR